MNLKQKLLRIFLLFAVLLISTPVFADDDSEETTEIEVSKAKKQQAIDSAAAIVPSVDSLIKDAINEEVKKAEVAKKEVADLKVFLIENDELSIGDKILISGPTTGEQEMTITEIFANGNSCESAKPGDQITFPTPFRIRLSDKLYKILA